MPTNILLLLVFETTFLIVFIIIALVKTKNLSELLKEVTNVPKDGIKGVEHQKERDGYLAMVVHELRSPLAIIKGSSDLMLKDAQSLSTRQIQMLLHQIRSSSTEMLKMVNNILDVSKMESGAFEIEKVPGDFNKFLRDECDYFSSSAIQKKIGLKVLLQENLPLINFDSVRIREVFNNLLSNAFKFTPEGGTVTVTANKVDNNVQVCVSDTGIGISDEIKPRLFHKFVQASNHRFVKEYGTGLGLVIAKGIVEAHGGKIWIEDNKPKGTKFIFTIPATP